MMKMVMMMIKVIVDVYLAGFFKLPIPGLANFSTILKCFCSVQLFANHV